MFILSKPVRDLKKAFAAVEFKETNGLMFTNTSYNLATGQKIGHT